MRRLGALVLALALVPAVPARASNQGLALEAGARASVLAGTIDVQPAFDPAIVDSRSTSSTSGAASLQSVVWPSFLVDAFFFLYGFQSVERLALGIAEARWPQGPEEANGSLSDLAFANGGDPGSVPGKAGRAQARTEAAHAYGSASIADAVLAGALSIGHATSRSDAATTGGKAVASAGQAVTAVDAGALRIASISGTVSVEAGFGAPKASASLVVGGATVAGVPVEIEGGGVRAATQAQQEQVNDALAAAGLEVRLVPGSESGEGDTATASSGGVLVAFAAEATDPTGTPRNARIGFLLGSSSATARAVPTGGSPPVVEDDTASPEFETRTIFIPPASGTPGPAVRAAGPLIRRRTIITPIASFPASARGAYGVVMLLALGLLLIRPLLRAASRA